MHSFEPLTPSSFLSRSATVYADRLAVVDGQRRYTYAQLGERVARLASALVERGATRGARVAVLAPNTHLLLEATLGVPPADAVLVALNVRLSAAELVYIVEHAEAELLLCDVSTADLAATVASRADQELPVVVAGGADDAYEALLSDAPASDLPAAAAVASAPNDERDLLAINYTSGTTGKPKGVMYHHRGAYLQALAMAYHLGLGLSSRYLWTLPMFHCNGWCFPWAVTLAGATHVCLRKLGPDAIWQLIHDEGVTHFCAAPTVLSSIVEHPQASAQRAGPPIVAATGGAPPSPALLDRAAQAGIDVAHLYGLTETFGPAVICDWRPEWDELPVGDRAARKARQGVSNVISERLRVVDEHGGDVPADGRSMGEIALRGNNVMLGYYDDEGSTRHAIPDGWFRTGDLAVVHPDGYVELRDRAKDVIISGGENIASVEVEQALASHPAVLEVAVVGMPDDDWGEVPAAFVTLHADEPATAEELTDHVRARLARFKVPKHFEFGPLPKTSTGKIPKYDLRRRLTQGPEATS